MLFSIEMQIKLVERVRVFQRKKNPNLYDSSSIFFLCSENFLSLSKHVHVHWRKERYVEQHSDHNKDGEAEGSIEIVGKVDAENILLVGVGQAGILAEQLTRHPNRVGDDEEGVPRRLNERDERLF